MDTVFNFIRSLNIENKTVVIGLSGGPDSMFLSYLLLQLREELNIKIVAAHVHHNLRQESDSEALFVKEYCDNNNIIFEMMKIEKYPDNKFSEDKAREIRYDFFKNIINKYNADILFTAHHADDLMETILMRLTRGSTLKGYAGFECISMDKGYKIAKPLIFLQKTDILKYLKQFNIHYVIDMSNKSNHYTRNRYRNYILPKLKEENPQVHKKFIKYSNRLLEANEYILKQTKLIYDDVVSNNEIDIIKFNSLDNIIKITLLEMYLKEIYKDNIIAINNKHIDLIFDSINKTNTMINLPLNKILKVEYDKLKIFDYINTTQYEYILDKNIILDSGKIIYKKEDTDTTNYTIYLNSKELSLPLYVRNRRKNDKMVVKNMNGHKKINDIFTDLKVPAEERPLYPIVVDNNNTIIWIPGIKKSNFDKKNKGKYDIILKYIKKEDKYE